MFIRKFLNASKVDDVNAKGRFIKVMNCENVIRLRATYQGNLVLDSDARAGFDVQTSQPFDQIQITSETEQKLELWVSEHKLSYDALSTKANSSSSFLVNHYGGSQSLVGYDPSQARLKIVSDKQFFIGGEGVNEDNGLQIQRGDIYTHDSAAPLYAYIEDEPSMEIRADSPEEFIETKEGNSEYIRFAYNGDLVAFDDFANGYIFNVQTKSFIQYEGAALSGVIGYKDGFIGCSYHVNTAYFKFIDKYGGVSNLFNIVIGNILGSYKSPTSGNVVFYGNEGTGAGAFAFIAELTQNGEINKTDLTASGVDGVLKRIDYDLYDEKFYVSIGSDYYRYNLDFTGKEQFALNMDAATYGQGSNGAFAIFSMNSGTDRIVMKETREVKILSSIIPNAKGGMVIGEQAIIFNSHEIYATRDGVITYKVKELGGDWLKQGAFAYKGKLYLVASKEGSEGFASYELSVDKNEVKAKFRVFKESF